MRVTVNVQPLSWGHCGTRNYLQCLLPELAKSFPELRFNFVTDRPVELPIRGARCRTIPPLQRSLKSRMMWETLAFPLATMGIAADLVHVPFQQAQFWSRQPRVMTVHDTVIFEPDQVAAQDRNQAFYFSLIRRAVLRARAVLTVSEFSKSRIVELIGVHPDRVIVTPIAASPAFNVPPSAAGIEAFKATHGLPRPYILYVGGTGMRKNIPNLLRAYRALHPDLRASYDLVVAGNLHSDARYHVEARALVAEPLKPGVIHVIDSIDQEELPAAYAGAAAFVFPSLYEGFGLSPLEAMCCGAPVLTSNRTSMPEVAGDAAIFFDPSSVLDLTSGLTAVLQSPELQASLRERGFKRAKQFTWGNTARLTMSAYEMALSR